MEHQHGDGAHDADQDERPPEVWRDPHPKRRKEGEEERKYRDAGEPDHQRGEEPEHAVEAAEEPARRGVARVREEPGAGSPTRAWVDEAHGEMSSHKECGGRDHALEDEHRLDPP